MANDESMSVESGRNEGNFLVMNKANGIPVPPFIDQKRMDELKDWAVLPDDVYIVTYPKSGTTWTQQIAKLIKNNGVDNGVELATTIKWLAKDGPASCKDVPPPRYLKSHDTYEMIHGVEPTASPAKYVYIARNPKDVAVSYYHHLKLFTYYEFTGTWEWYFEQFFAGNVPSGSWFDHVLGWWKHKEAQNILFLKYEDMKKDLHKAVDTLGSFLGYQLEPQVVDTIAKQCSFDSMKDNPSANYSWLSSHCRDNKVTFMRKGDVGDWKNYFTEDQNRRFDEEYSKRMKNSGLDFDFEV